MNICRLGFYAVLLILGSSGSLRAQEDISTVVGICSVCHGPDGLAAGFPDVPIIAGTPAGHLEEALFSYIDGARQCKKEPVMCQTIAGLSDDQITAVAAYFASKPRVASGEPYNKYLAAAGEKLHQEHCARCHVPPGDPKADGALGIPLHGQKAAYLRYAFDAYASGDRLALIPQMAQAMAAIDRDDFEALINYYSSYAP